MVKFCIICCILEQFKCESEAVSYPFSHYYACLGKFCHYSIHSVGELCLSPSLGTPHSGGLLSVNGPFQQHLFENRNDIRMKFEGKDEVLYTKCSYEEGNPVAYCPAPLFGPNSIGIKIVTLLIGGCTTGYTGQYIL